MTQHLPQLNRSQSIELVTQIINELEAQGLLMVFDRHDHVAQRLTGDLRAAGVLQEGDPGESALPTQPQPADERSTAVID